MEKAITSLIRWRAISSNSTLKGTFDESGLFEQLEVYGKVNIKHYLGGFSVSNVRFLAEDVNQDFAVLRRISDSLWLGW